MKGGLISLAAATVGLTNEAAQHLEVRVAYKLFYFRSSSLMTKKLTLPLKNKDVGCRGLTRAFAIGCRG